MNKCLETAKLLRKEIEETSEFKLYQENKQLLETNEDLKDLKKQIVRAKNENRIDDYNFLKTQYDQNPLVINFNESKNELSSLLYTLVKIIS